MEQRGYFFNNCILINCYWFWFNDYSLFEKRYVSMSKVASHTLRSSSWMMNCKWILTTILFMINWLFLLSTFIIEDFPQFQNGRFFYSSGIPRLFFIPTMICTYQTNFKARTNAFCYQGDNVFGTFFRNNMSH